MWENAESLWERHVGELPSPCGRGMWENAESQWERHWKCRVPVGEACGRTPSPSGSHWKCRVPVGEACENAESLWERHVRKPSPSGRGMCARLVPYRTSFEEIILEQRVH
ncbi:hypothetical protein Adt_22948 [Abeliophyllum distichum]|uniref:Uncharacterized protein n=1 Tax=Abeliophyllum distichum TaxID=126358 RepID=A0ABD1SAJ0_9LAMI